MKLRTYVEALGQLNKLHQYVTASIDYGEMNKYRKPSPEQLIDIISQLFK